MYYPVRKRYGSNIEWHDLAVKGPAVHYLREPECVEEQERVVKGQELIVEARSQRSHEELAGLVWGQNGSITKDLTGD